MIALSQTFVLFIPMSSSDNTVSDELCAVLNRPKENTSTAMRCLGVVHRVLFLLLIKTRKCTSLVLERVLECSS